METTDHEDQTQRATAEEAIATTAKRYTSKKRRIEMLGHYRADFQAQDWQIAIDLVEAQMIAWGRVEQTENTGLYASYTQQMNHYRVAIPKEEWRDEEYQRHGDFRAYAYARYTIRFMTVADALVHLEDDLKSLLKNLQKSHLLDNNPNDQLRVVAYSESMHLIMDEMRALLSPTNPPSSPAAPVQPPTAPSPDSP